eukprot:350724-Chlamydomonas_euryale.AAC.7
MHACQPGTHVTRGAAISSSRHPLTWHCVSSYYATWHTVETLCAWRHPEQHVSPPVFSLLAPCLHAGSGSHSQSQSSRRRKPSRSSPSRPGICAPDRVAQDMGQRGAIVYPRSTPPPPPPPPLHACMAARQPNVRNLRRVLRAQAARRPVLSPARSPLLHPTPRT